MVPEDFSGWVPEDQMDIVMDSRGGMCTDFCDLDGTIKSQRSLLCFSCCSQLLRIILRKSGKNQYMKEMF